MPAPNRNPTEGDSSRRCLITGSTGYVGSQIRARLEADGWHVTELRRNPGSSEGAIRFQLGDAIAPGKLTGHSALVHCAYDFRQISWEDIASVNVRGSELLLRAAVKAGVRQIVFISSISAYEGCRSLYGRAKLDIEHINQTLGGWNIRPGLVYGNAPGAMFGRLVLKAQKSKFIPLPGNGRQRQYLVHESDLCAAVCRCVEPARTACTSTVTVAHERPWTLRELLSEIASGLGNEVFFFPVPWRLAWAALRLGEILRIPLDFRSDSLMSLVHQNPIPTFNSFELLGVRCRPFEFRKHAMLPEQPIPSSPITS
jgi:nucleoside-diphosphate-sugar epimerase